MGLGNYIFWSEIGSGFRELGGTTPPRIPRSTPPPATLGPSTELCWADARATYRKQQHPNFEWRGNGQDRYILFCSPKLPCLNNFIPDCKPSFGLSLRMKLWNAQNTIFFSTYHCEFHFTYIFMTREHRLHKPSRFLWAPLPTYNSYMYSCIVLFFG